jgi:uncharacterized protein (DUF2147 family)
MRLPLGHDAVFARASALALSMLVLMAGITTAPIPALAQEAPSDTTAARAPADFSPLVGRWVRPDGGYVVTIKSVSADGKLDASYQNPNLLPFSRAEAARDDDEIQVVLELTAGGYGGSTYTLIYDPEQDVLRGVYFQAVAHKSYHIFFERANDETSGKVDAE